MRPRGASNHPLAREPSPTDPAQVASASAAMTVVRCEQPPNLSGNRNCKQRRFVMLLASRLP